MKGKGFVPTFEYPGHKGMSADELAADLEALDALKVDPWSSEAEKLRRQAEEGKIETGIKEIFYIRLLPADEMSDYICTLPYTLVESIFESALNNEDGVINLLAQAIEILKQNMNLYGNAKKALRKLLKVCQVLGCAGEFDFGDWEAFRNEGNPAITIEPPKSIKNIVDLSITNFPENADNKDREMLNQLAGNYLIDRKLSSEKKYKLSRPVFCKEVVKELLKQGYNKNSGFIFIQRFIDHHVEPPTIQHYFRTCKKDMPPTKKE